MTDIVERLRSFKENVSNDMIELLETPEVCTEAADAIEARDAEIERLRAEVDFLHKRRGEIAIERDRYKAALAEYPEGRDVFLGGALAEIERLKALLLEADTEITNWMYHGHGSTESGFGSAPLLNRIRAALGIAKE